MAGIFVYCPRCQEQTATELIKILDVWEGIMGEDNVRYICPHCGEEVVAKPVGRWYDPNMVEDYYED